MRVLSRSTIIGFYTKHPDAKASLEHWYNMAIRSKWTQPSEAIADFSKAKILDGERVRYEIAGGKYRLVVKFKWNGQIAYIRFVGTHNQYDAIDAMTV